MHGTKAVQTSPGAAAAPLQRAGETPVLQVSPAPVQALPVPQAIPGTVATSVHRPTDWAPWAKWQACPDGHAESERLHAPSRATVTRQVALAASQARPSPVQVLPVAQAALATEPRARQTPTAPGWVTQEASGAQRFQAEAPASQGMPTGWAR